MRLLKALADLLEWRWAPAAALSSAAVLYVVVAVALIPDRIDAGDERTPATFTALQPRPPSTSVFAARIGNAVAPAPPLDTDKEEEAEKEKAGEEPQAPTAQVLRTITSPRALESVTHLVSRRGFSPPLSRPEPQPEPPPPVGAAAPVTPPPADSPPPPASDTLEAALPGTANATPEPSAPAPNPAASASSERPTEDAAAPAPSASAPPAD